jgi:4-hydroxy-3-polyprenylbenzoate decarboxylase
LPDVPSCGFNGMGYRHLAECIADLERTRQLVRIHEEIDPHLEAAEIHRRVYRAGGPALFFERVKGTPFPMVSNLFGSIERTRFLFRDALEQVHKLVELKVDPQLLRRNPWRYWNLPSILWRLRPKHVRRGPILSGRTTVRLLPQLKCWPLDGGAFVTLPQVYTEHPDRPGWRYSNLGMYRVQLSGNEFEHDREVGLHYQTHRGIGVHHHAAIQRGEKLKVNIIVGGPPCLAVAAVMPLPESLPELAFAAALGGRRLSLVPAANGLSMPAEADFVISGTIDPSRTKPEGPFGDHLGYYSLAHEFPVMTVEQVYHRTGAIWPFTVVGRPPQEDTTFGTFIHELTGPIIPTVIPGVKAVHAVDAAGVHPLLLAIGSERYVPYAGERKPQELLTQANAILGQGQLSLAKYLFLVAGEDDPALDIHDITAFFRHILERFDPTRDLHFQTRTTMDTLDYSAGCGLNNGSKLVLIAAGPKKRTLGSALPDQFSLPSGLSDPRIATPGILVIRAANGSIPDDWCEELGRRNSILQDTTTPFPLIVLVDDADFASRNLGNFLWITFTRSDPANDVSGIGEKTIRKHWSCTGSVVIDARLKSHMPPPCEEDAAVTRKVNEIFTRGGPLAGIER